MRKVVQHKNLHFTDALITCVKIISCSEINLFNRNTMLVDKGYYLCTIRISISISFVFNYRTTCLLSQHISFAYMCRHKINKSALFILTIRFLTFFCKEFAKKNLIHFSLECRSMIIKDNRFYQNQPLCYIVNLPSKRCNLLL